VGRDGIADRVPIKRGIRHLSNNVVVDLIYQRTSFDRVVIQSMIEIRWKSLASVTVPTSATGNNVARSNQNGTALKCPIQLSNTKHNPTLIKKMRTAVARTGKVTPATIELQGGAAAAQSIVSNSS
jgi:hypothetical protein